MPEPKPDPQTPLPPRRGHRARRFLRHRHHHPHGDCSPSSTWVLRHRLQWRLFWWFGATIIATGAAVALTFAVLAPGTAWRQDVATLRQFLARELANSWETPARRQELLQGVRSALHLRLSLQDADGRILDQDVEPCRHEHFRLEIERAGARLGALTGCWQHPERGGYVFLGLGVACVTLWAASFLLARRISRPLSDLVRVTREIGAGRLSSRIALHRGREGEVGLLAEAINEMAARIEKQIRDQRELLAAVSHEIRSPLARLRVLTELVGEDNAQPQRLAEIEREILEIDALVGKLLASSRIEFGALQRQPLQARRVAEQALLRANASTELLWLEPPDLVLRADPTLLGRALGNLLENAERHAGGIESLCVRAAGDRVVFEVNDRGPGFPEASLLRVFDAFYSPARPATAQDASAGELPSDAGHAYPSLGLGLALVRRIAQAHGGSASAHNREGGGASVRLELPRASEAQAMPLSA